MPERMKTEVDEDRSFPPDEAGAAEPLEREYSRSPVLLNQKRDDTDYISDYHAVKCIQKLRPNYTENTASTLFQRGFVETGLVGRWNNGHFT